MKYESESLKIIHQDAIEMFKIGAITEARMREYDEMCLKKSNAKKNSSAFVDDKSSDIKHTHAIA